MNLLPGLRELRAPLAAGYLWIIATAVWANELGWLPASRPAGDGWLARAWDIGGTLGRTALLAMLTFIAYLIGSFLEVGSDSRRLQRLTRLLLRRYPQYSLDAWLDRPVRPESDIDQEVQDILINEPQWLYLSNNAPQYARLMGGNIRVANLLSPQARDDLVQLIVDRGDLPPERTPELPEPISTDVMLRVGVLANGALQNGADMIILHILDEVPQLASRLLVANGELYGRYDRFVAEANFRVNVSLPLALLLGSLVWTSSLPLLAKLSLSVLVVAIGTLLLRQGLQRAIAARDVIAQAIAIGQVQSRHISDEGTGGTLAEITRDEASRAGMPLKPKRKQE
jgi:hypothetical protein